MHSILATCKSAKRTCLGGYCNGSKFVVVVDQQVRRRFDAAVVIGFMLKGGALRINPPEDLPLDEGARVIALAPNGASPLIVDVWLCVLSFPC